MLLKLIGATLVVCAGGYIGFSLASRCAARPEQLRQMLSCVVSLRSCMNYASMPLADGLTQCASGAGKTVQRFFFTAAQTLNNDYTATPREAVEKALGEGEHQLALCRADRETLLLFGSHLGSMDKREQQNHLTMIEKRLEILEREAVSLRDHNGKMYRYVGVCGSLMIVLLFI